MKIPCNLEKLKKYLAERAFLQDDYQYAFELGFIAAVEAMEKEMRVVEIPEKKCDDDNGDCHFFCQKEFETECQLYKKDLHDVINKIETLYEYIKPSFCTAKRVKILIED